MKAKIIYDTYDIKLSVIRWIKEAKKNTFYCTICEKFNCDCGSSECFKIHELDEIIKWVKYYHSITDEEVEKC